MDEPPRDNSNISIFTVFAFALLLLTDFIRAHKSGERHTDFISSSKRNKIIGVIRNIHSPIFFVGLLS